MFNTSPIRRLTPLRHVTDQPAAALGRLTPREYFFVLVALTNIWRTWVRVRPQTPTTPSLPLQSPKPSTHFPTMGYTPATAWLAPQPPPSGNANTRRMASSSSKPRHGVSTPVLPNFSTSRTSGNSKGPRHHPYPQAVGASSTKKGKGKAMATESDPVVRNLDFDLAYYPYPVCLLALILFAFLINLIASGRCSRCRWSRTSHSSYPHSSTSSFGTEILPLPAFPEGLPYWFAQRQCPIPAKRSDFQSLCCKRSKFREATIIWTHSDIFHFAPWVFWPSLGNLASQTEIYMGPWYCTRSGGGPHPRPHNVLHLQYCPGYP
jgi:hypothetical protein